MIQVSPDGVDLSRYKTIPEPATARELILSALEAKLDQQGTTFDAKRFTAGYSGHLYPGRGIELILDMADRLPGVNFLIMGGEPDQVFEYRCWPLNASCRTRAHRIIPNADLPQYQAACDPFFDALPAPGGGLFRRDISPLLEPDETV
jgi:glycosyltransferase involved in cell wall biosynthesis